MECNKEEAIRAKDIAQKKMESKDFIGARKIAIKAQQLYPDLENISQMILVCEVHCSAENIVYGTEKDWYGILKIEQTADDAAIRKQFRKLALLLHPDKNRFAGAADAFKLIGDAQAVLIDREKRMQFDYKCKAFRIPQAPNIGKPPWLQNNFMNNVSSQFMNQQRQQPKQATQEGLYSNEATRIVCPFCSCWIHYYKHAINKILTCPTCRKSFNENEIPPVIPPGANKHQAAFPQKKEAASQCPFSNASGSFTASQRNVFNEKEARGAQSKTGCNSGVGMRSTPSNSSAYVDSNINKRGPTEVSKKSGKRRKTASESSLSCDTVEDEEEEEDDDDNLAGNSFRVVGNQYPRRSTRHKQRVFYSEKASDDEEEGEEKVNLEESLREEILKNRQKEDAKENEAMDASVDDERSFQKSTTEPETYVYDDPEFSDFDKDKMEESFANGQIWAVYDELDGMPRFYALIKKVLSPGFKLQIMWLEPVPENQDEKIWVAEGLPASCGKFGLLNSETTTNLLMFSHLVHWQNGGKKSLYKIYPRKGETWALFKNWNINWYSNPGNHKSNYEFEFVEVLSDYDDATGVSVASLGKVKGFRYLFGRINKEGIVLIQAKDLFRFSHRVPSFQMTGNEGVNVPKGSFELDPASLPANFSGVLNSDPTKDGKTYFTSSCFTFPVDVGTKNDLEKNVFPKKKPADLRKTSGKSEESTFVNSAVGQKDEEVRIDSSSDAAAVSKPEWVIPEAEFHNFDDGKSMDKFQVNQIWAIYSDEEALPKYYGLIKRIDTIPELTFHVAWLCHRSPSRNMIRWTDKTMPVCCGEFMVKGKKSLKMVGAGAFSHKLMTEPANKKGVYLILPRKGEIWALYKNWNPEIKCSELGNCEYEVVEVVEVSDEWVLGVLLEPVPGYNSVFRTCKGERAVLTVEVPRSQILLRFSHQIPAFSLTNNHDGSLEGCWELDPAAVPQHLLCSR